MGLVLALTAAHPHPHPHPNPHTHAMCVVGGSPHHEARHLLGRLPHCLRGIKPFKHHRSVLRQCKNQVKKRLITDRKDFKKDLLDPETMKGVVAEAWEGVAACLVERLQLEKEDGTLDTQKLVKATAGMGGKDIWKMKYMQAMVVTCAANTTADNSTQQLKEVMECVQAGALEFCENKMNFAKRWLQSSAEESVCSSVVVPPEPREACVACAKELGVSEALCGGGTSEEEDAMIQFPDSTQLDPEEAEWTVQMCASERLGWYRPADGFLFTKISDAIANFTGWDDIPEARDNVTQAIVDCAPSFDGDVQVEALLWSSCFMPTLLDACGFRSNITSMFFPGLHRTMSREVKQLMHGLVQVGDLGDDEDDDHDNNEAELVDAGLLERSLLDETQMEDGDTEGPRVRSANIRGHRKNASDEMGNLRVMKGNLEPATSEPTEDASSDVPPEPEPSGTPPGDPSDTPPGESSGTPLSDSTSEASGGSLDDTSDKVLLEPSGNPLQDIPDEVQK